ncbi:outer membrane autotransporter barrel [Synechococcus phage S-SCSM1]|uniref:Outer membrane autotransporter barrel n=1 Tax=Synechococcus phage S-SCSM1 TaxID=2588487 RepID=A0A6M2ZHQ3_9CAUD|nr:outer membrane autotransporter barrel [Synechococcus phage S-SCSM1]QFG06402.1 outer membrane autotransporter barrel [Synechococcus phage S-SCSM1]
MIKSVFAATAALSMSAGAALAGPYVNVETNAGWTGSDYNGAATDLHVGYEGAIGETGASFYVQGGPAILTPDGGDTETVFTGKAGVGAPITDQLGLYGEVSFATAPNDGDTGYGGKLGVKYSF